MIKRDALITAVCGCVLCLCAAARSEPPLSELPRSVFAPRAADSLTLLESPAIRRELELTNDQRQGVADVRELQAEELEKVKRELAARFDSMLEDVLLPHQLQRLCQLRVQALGLDALIFDDHVRRRLKLTDSQRQKIEELRRHFVKDVQAEFLAAQGAALAFAPMQRRGRDLLADRERRTLAVLTPQQRRNWASLQGEPLRP